MRSRLSRVGQLALNHGTKDTKHCVMGPGKWTVRGSIECEQFDHLMDRLDGRITLRARFAANPIRRRRRRIETDCRQTRQVFAQTNHFTHALPGSVQNENDELTIMSKQSL